MIATARVLRLRVRRPGDVGRAARAVVAYVEGGQPGAAAVAVYYGRAAGRSRGRLAGLVGLRGAVPAEALMRLLEGRHAVTDRPLLGDGPGPRGRRLAGGWDVGTGSGQARRNAATPANGDELLTLAEAAVLAGVSVDLLRLRVRQAARAAGQREAGEMADLSPESAGVVGPRGVADSAEAVGPPDGRLLAGERGADGRWRVHREDLERWMAARVAPATVLGYDVVCAAPKSVSLLWAFGDAATRADVAAALDAAVDATIGYLERHAAFGMVGWRNRPALGLAVASYLHDVSRSVEAHLHVHNIVINAVAVRADADGVPRDAAGRPGEQADGVQGDRWGAEEGTAAGAGGVGGSGWVWRAVDGEVLLPHIRTAGFVGAAVLRHELTARRGLEWGPVRNGVAELAAFPTELLAAFSTRHGEVMEEFAQLVAAGLEPSGATMAAAQRRSRAPKRVLADDTVHAAQVERLAAAGWTVEQVRELAAPVAHRPAPVGHDDVAELFDLLAGSAGVTEKVTTFGRRDVVRAIAAWGGDRLDAAAVERLADRFLADRRVVLVLADTPGRRRRQDPEPLYTVEDLLAAERRLVALIRQGRVVAGAAPRILAEPGLVDAHLAAATVGPALSGEQADLVRRLVADGDLVRFVVGAAGTGKTEAMRVLAGIARAAGRRVFATAHGGRQTEELADRIGVPGRVVAGWLTLLDAVAADPAGDLAEVWPQGSVLIVDEATQVGTRDAARLLDYAARTGTVVILLGDPAQLGSVAAGGWFTHLVHQLPDVPTLTTPHRQAGPELAAVRAALDALRADATSPARAALDRLADAGKIRLADDPDALLEQAVADWYAERRRHLDAERAAPSVPTGADGADGAGLADRAGTDDDGAHPPADRGRRRRQPDGGPLRVRVRLMAERHRDVERLNQAARALLTADGTLTGPVLAVAGREFQAGDEVVTLTQAGHTLVPAGRPATAYIRTGAVGVVTAVHVDPDDPGTQTVTVHFPSKGIVTVPWAYLTHRFDDGRDGGLAHAYALTAAKAQGSTMDTARAVVTDDTSRAGLYVMLSRARRDLAAYLLRRDELDQADDDETWLSAAPGPGPDDPLDRLATRLDRSRTEQFADARDPIAATAHQLRLAYPLAALTAARLGHPDPAAPFAPTAPMALFAPDGPRRADPNNGAPFAPSQAAPFAPLTPLSAPRVTEVDAPAGGGGPAEEPPRQVVLRRAELAAEAAIRAAALADPPAALVARIGPPPAAAPDRALWDSAVTNLAIYHARHQPDVPSHVPGPPPGARPDDRVRDPWLRLRDQATGLADAWAAVLPADVRARFRSADEAVPRDRAVVGLHALLDAGYPPAALTAALRQDPVDSVRAAAAVLDHRVADLCRQAGVDPALYDLPAATTAQQDWNTVTDLLGRAESGHLATSPTAALAVERRSLEDRLTRRPDILDIGDALSSSGQTPEGNAPGGPAGAIRARADLEARLGRVNTALDRQIGDAVLQAAAEPAGYLTVLLGPRPASGPAAAGWDEAASRVERYRHRHLGLPYGTPADPASADPVVHALGTRPDALPAADDYAEATSATLPGQLAL
ncbi:MobF family relaxase [Pseudofrankia asymbiotica]|uniref:TrwC relaxase n=1 Tax=Pseudofrankia asymbiotica TaxID=1834516 RepID=A0A1V2I482_9ACTN|nr:MobF family relaxase [Pseudofrankia asymbiotica]ONH25523.1 TrwC relaxase [Pseudofrankia asymbiotica]